MPVTSSAAFEPPDAYFKYVQNMCLSVMCNCAQCSMLILSVHPSVVLTYRGHISWVVLELIILESLEPMITSLVQGEHLQILHGIGVWCLFRQKVCSISEMG